MATTLALAMRASMSASGVVSGANDAARAMDRMGKQAQQTARDVSTLKTIAIGAVLAKGVSLAADAFISAGRAAVSYASNVAQAVDQTNDLAQRIGMGVESLQALQMAAKLSGIDDAAGALQKLTVAIGKAAETGDTDAFAKLGINFRELQAMSPEEQFRAVQQAIAALPTPAERAAAAVALFGRSGVELLPLMSQNLAEVEDRMRRLGAIVGQDQVEAIGSMNDSLDMVRATFDGIIGQVVGNLAPVVESLAEEFLSFVESFNSVSGSGGEGIANAITDAMLDIVDYLAGVFDNAVAGFDGFGVTLQEVGAIFDFVGNVFTAVAETLRAAFNMFQVAGNLLAVAIGKMLEGIGSYVSSDLEQFGRDMAANAADQARQNAAEGDAALGNAGRAAGRAIFGGERESATGPARRAVAAARARMSPEARAQREAERKAREAEARAAREAAAAQAAVERIDEKIAAANQKLEEASSGRMAELRRASNESLRASDVRSSEGMAQYLALATGRDDPALVEYRKQNAKLEQIREELRALQQEKVDILGAAA